MSNYDYRLNKYISQAQHNCGEANQTDFKPTYKEELDHIDVEARKQAKLCVEFLEGMPLARQTKLRTFAIAKGMWEHEVDGFALITSTRPFMVGPRWLNHLEEFEKMEKVFG